MSELVVMEIGRWTWDLSSELRRRHIESIILHVDATWSQPTPDPTTWEPTAQDPSSPNVVQSSEGLPTMSARADADGTSYMASNPVLIGTGGLFEPTSIAQLVEKGGTGEPVGYRPTHWRVFKGVGVRPEFVEATNVRGWAPLPRLSPPVVASAGSRTATGAARINPLYGVDYRHPRWLSAIPDDTIGVQATPPVNPFAEVNVETYREGEGLSAGAIRSAAASLLGVSRPIPPNTGNSIQFFTYDDLGLSERARAAAAALPDRQQAETAPQPTAQTIHPNSATIGQWAGYWPPATRRITSEEENNAAQGS